MPGLSPIAGAAWWNVPEKVPGSIRIRTATRSLSPPADWCRKHAQRFPILGTKNALQPMMLFALTTPILFHRGARPLARGHQC